jgi:MtN3 and saliva related transmembrane protein
LGLEGKNNAFGDIDRHGAGRGGLGAVQVVRTWRTRSAQDLSLAWLVVALVSMVLWICYGSLVSAYAIVWANALTFVQASLILAIKLRGSEGRPSASSRL